MSAPMILLETAAGGQMGVDGRGNDIFTSLGPKGVGLVVTVLSWAAVGAVHPRTRTAHQ
ncbi:hypothetical protein [Tessaracoccus sp.]